MRRQLWTAHVGVDYAVVMRSKENTENATIVVRSEDPRAAHLIAAKIGDESLAQLAGEAAHKAAQRSALRIMSPTAQLEQRAREAWVDGRVRAFLRRQASFSRPKDGAAERYAEEVANLAADFAEQPHLTAQDVHRAMRAGQ